MNKQKLKEKVDQLTKQMQSLDQEIEIMEHTLLELEVERNLTELALSKSIIVTDHAIIKYLERIKSMNIEEIKGIILTPKLEEVIMVTGDGEYPNGDFKLVVRNNAVITVITGE